MKERNKRIAYGVLGIFIFLCIWYAATMFTSLGKVMPDPVTVIAGFCKAFVVPIGTHSMIMHILISLRRMLIPYAFGGVLGVLVQDCRFYSDAVHSDVPSNSADCMDSAFYRMVRLR